MTSRYMLLDKVSSLCDGKMSSRMPLSSEGFAYLSGSFSVRVTAHPCLASNGGVSSKRHIYILTFQCQASGAKRRKELPRKIAPARTAALRGKFERLQHWLEVARIGRSEELLSGAVDDRKTFR